jgi:isopenicillin-N epimerase
MRLIECEGTRNICLWLTYRRIRGRAVARQDPNADARIHELRPLAPHGLAGAGVGYVGAPGTDRGDDGVPPSWRDVRGRTAARVWERFRVEASVTILASTHFYNTETDIDRLAEALGELLPG